MQSYVVIQGPGEQQSTFTHPIGLAASTFNSDPQSSLFVATQQEGAGEYSVARIGTYYTFAEPLTPEKITLNDQKDVDNPLYNKPIAHLGLLNGNRLIIVPEHEQKAYLLENVASFRNISIASTSEFKDALGNQASKIVGVGATGAPQEIFFSFFVVAPENGVFGDQGSGVAVAVPYEAKVEIVDAEKNEKKEIIQKAYGQLAGQQDEYPDQVRAIPLSCQSEHLAIGGELKGLGGICAMHWNTRLSLLYIGLDTTAGDNPDDGARSIVVGSITKDKQLKLHAIAPESVFSTGREQEIVGSKGAGSRVTIHTIKSMNTSTSLDYLIVHGGNHTLYNTKRFVFALPLVNMRTEKGAPDEHEMPLHGQIACKDTLPEDLFGAVSSNAVFFGRRFKKPAHKPEDLPLARDKSIMVGGGPLVHGDIEDVVVQDDVVFVSVVHAEQNQLPGIFYSRALFDEHGRVKGWSAWARASSITDPVWRLKYNNIVGSFIALTADKANHPVNVVQTTWSAGEEHGLGSLVTLLTNEFPQNKAGVQGLFDFPAHQNGLGNRSLIIATGAKKVALIESDIALSDYQEHNVHYVTETVPACAESTHALVFSCPGIESVGAITHAGLVSTPHDTKIVVAGSRGIAVLCDQQGNGWSTNEGMLAGFSNLAGMSFKKIGSYQMVRKIVAQENQLFVLTDKTLDRIDMSRSNCNTNELNVTRIAEAGETFGSKYAVFLDLVVSDKLALLATSKGLYRMGNACDCRTAHGQESCRWAPVAINGCTMPITQVSVASLTGAASDFAKYDGGMLYVLCGDRGSNRSKVYRFSVAPVHDNSIDEHTIMPLPDVAVGSGITHYANMGSYRNAMVTDGSLVFNAKEKEVSGKLIIDSNARGNRNAVPIDVKEYSQVSAFVRNSARGCWMISGDFGLRVHE
jgi:hypothetical protein